MNFTFRFLKGDVLGGLTAGIVALPLALAFGVSSSLGPIAGLYGAIFISFFWLYLVVHPPRYRAQQLR